MKRKQWPWECLKRWRSLRRGGWEEEEEEEEEDEKIKRMRRRGNEVRRSGRTSGGAGE